MENNESTFRFFSPISGSMFLQKVCLEAPDSTFPEDTSGGGSWYEVAMSQVVSSKFQVFILQVLPLRGYNESGKPDGIDAYHMETLVADIKCLVKELGVEKFTLVRFTT